MLKLNQLKAKFISGRKSALLYLILIGVALMQIVVVGFKSTRPKPNVGVHVFITMISCMCFLLTVFEFCMTYINFNLFACKKTSTNAPIITFAISFIVFGIYLSALLLKSDDDGCSIFGCVKDLV